MFGDQLGDFIDGAVASTDAREKMTHDYLDWFGQRWFALPNPDYGSWQEAITHFSGDPKHKTSPRTAMHGALRDQ